jgi:hypothetical protein
MDFKKFLTMMSEAETTAEKDNKAEKAGKKVAKDIEYDEGNKGKDDEKAEKAGEKVKKDIEYDDKKDKKSLKDWFEIIDRTMLAEAEQVTIEPAKQSTQVIRQGTKTIGTVSNPQLAAQIKQSIGKGEMSLAGHEMKEEALDEKWAGDAEVKPTGQYKDKSVAELKSMLAKLKKSSPHDKDSPAAKKMRQINFALRAKGGWKSGEGAAMKEEELAEKAKNPYAIGMAQAMKSTGDEPPLEKSTITKAHKIAKKIKKTDEGEIPSSGPDYGAGLGAGRKDNMLEAKPDFLDLDKDGNKKESMKKAAADKKKKKVDEAMNTCEAAYHEGKAHGLTKHGYACRYDHGSQEHEHYHKGFKEGLDECYGLMPVQGLVVGETMPAATVPGMASQAMPAMEADVGEGNAFGQAVRAAKADGIQPGEKINVGGKSYPVKEDDVFAFEALDKQLNDLLNEGVSVNMSQGLEGAGGGMDDSVSVTATGDDSAKLLAFIKQVGLGGLGDEKTLDTPASPGVAVVSDYGAPKFSGHDGMTDLLSKVTDDSDYKDEEGHGDVPKMKMCGTHGVDEGKCGCGEGKEMVDEVETEDQMEYEVAEADGDSGDSGQIEMGKSEAEEDEALAKAAQQDKEYTVNEGGDGMEDEEVEEAKEEKLDEWANDAGKKGTDQAFERDIEFMTKVISGGLNKPKSTGQTTIPVIAGQDARTGDEDVTAWKKLAGLMK